MHVPPKACSAWIGPRQPPAVHDTHALIFPFSFDWFISDGAGSSGLCTGFLWLQGPGLSLRWLLVADGGLQGDCASGITARGLSCSAACGISPAQGLNSCPCTGRWILMQCMPLGESPCISFNIRASQPAPRYVVSASPCGARCGLLPPSPAPHSTHTLGPCGLCGGGPSLPSPTHWPQTPVPRSSHVDAASSQPQTHAHALDPPQVAPGP